MGAAHSSNSYHCYLKTRTKRLKSSGLKGRSSAYVSISRPLASAIKIGWLSPFGLAKLTVAARLSVNLRNFARYRFFKFLKNRNLGV